MDKDEGDTGKGKIVLATVKGDVHDIGKNLVEIILSNNGFKVVDIGIKVTPSTLIDVIRKEKPDIIGLSGLLVKSAQQMVITAQDFKAAGIDLPDTSWRSGTDSTIYGNKNRGRIRWSGVICKRCDVRTRTCQSSCKIKKIKQH